MTFDEYQEQALKTSICPRGPYNIVYPVLGLTGESGEVADKVKKVLRDDRGIFTPEKIKEISLEMGDVLWYLAALAGDMGITLEGVAKGNIEKINSRVANNTIHGSGDKR